MFKIPRFILFLMIFMMVSSCNQDPCEISHVMIDGECIPDYVFPPNSRLKSGDRYYHSIYGVITFKDGVWFDINNRELEKLNAK